MKRGFGIVEGAILAVLALALVAPTAAGATTFTQGSALTGTTTTINNGPGDQTDPHVSGDLAAYTSVVNGASNIHYFDFLTGSDTLVDNGGAFDFLPDVSGSNVVFTRAGPGTQAIYLDDTAATTPTPVELDPLVGSARREGRIGGNTVVWEDFGLGALPGSDALVAWDLATNTLSTIINDGRVNKDAELSPDGNVVTWVNCALDGTGCVVDDAVKSGGVWGAPRQLTTNGGEAHPDTNGSIVVYASTRTVNGTTSSHIYYQPVGGGIEQQVDVGAGNQYNPTISGNLVAFEGENLTAATGNTDIYVADLTSDTYYDITNTSQNETLNDISLDATGLARVIWQVQSGTAGGWDIYAFSFMPPQNLQQQIANLANTITGFGLPHGLTTSLLAKLSTAQADFQAGDTPLACQDLQDLINEATAQSGKGLTLDQTNQIINAAQAIRQSIGC